MMNRMYERDAEMAYLKQFDNIVEPIGMTGAVPSDNDRK